MRIAQNQQIKESAPSRIHELLARRRSPYAFSSRPVEPEKLRRLFQAARWAPSSYNEQPWNFLVAPRENVAEYLSLLGTLAEVNQQWARQAPVLVLAVAKLAFDKGGRTNGHSFYDVGQAVADLTVQATAEGLFVHQMGGFDADRARQLLRIPQGYEPVAVMAIGYLGDSELSSPAQPRARKPLEKFVFSGTWGQPSPLVASDADPEGDSYDQSD